LTKLPLDHAIVTFVVGDFVDAFANQEIDIQSLTPEEWRSFEKMFMDGLQWDFVANEAAWNIAYERGMFD
jgi:hypothetical protein